MQNGGKMKKSLCLGMTLSLLLGSPPASGSVRIVEKKFSNCKELNAKYPGGVAKSASTVNRGGETKLMPFVSAKIYKENRTKDRDKDGIACEK